MPWQPPIPSGALYSKAARAIGPALPLLAYCYDLVQRDGWFDLSLKDAAGDLEEAYPTIKRWWHTIKEGPFFCEVTDRGRLGWRVRFKDIWIDWRVLQSRADAAPASRTNEVSEMSLENGQGHFKDISRTNEVSEMSLQSSGNKVLMTTDQAEIAQRAKRAAPAPQKTPEDQATNERKRAIEHAYVTELGYTPSAFAKEAKAAKWLAEHSYTPDQVVGCYRYLRKDEFYRKQHISLAVIAKQIGAWCKLKLPEPNGTHAPLAATRPDLPDKPVPLRDLAAAALAARKRGHDPS